jgi:hypothetical protein
MVLIPIILLALSTQASSNEGRSDVGPAHVPCYIKIAAGEERVIILDSQRKAELIVRNAADASTFTVTEYRNGTQRQDSQAETTKLDRNEYQKTWKFNKFFDQTPEASVVDEIKIAVQEGAVSAEVAQTGDHRIDFYNTGYQRGTTVNPQWSLSVRITGDHPSGSQTSGDLILEADTWDGQKKIPFTMEKGKTLTWDYPVEKRINSVEVDITEGQAKVSLFQPLDYTSAIPLKSKIKNAAKIKKPSKKVQTSPTAKTGNSQTKPSQTVEVATSGETVFNGQVPLMKGAKVLLNMSSGGNGQAQIDVSASPEEIITFYRETMVARGWKSPEGRVQGTMGSLKISKGKSTLTMLVQGTGQKSIITMGLKKE